MVAYLQAALRHCLQNWQSGPEQSMHTVDGPSSDMLASFWGRAKPQMALRRPWQHREHISATRGARRK